MDDAEKCIQYESKWYKGYIRRAKAYQKKGISYRQNAIDSYDDAILAVKAEHDSNISADNKLINELKRHVINVFKNYEKQT
ncbi:MAG: hypothetical protein ACI90V_002355 [Bacillariaceae sp.]